jgi:hypothetical protein
MFWSSSYGFDPNKLLFFFTKFNMVNSVLIMKWRFSQILTGKLVLTRKWWFDRKIRSWLILAKKKSVLIKKNYIFEIYNFQTNMKITVLTHLDNKDGFGIEHHFQCFLKWAEKLLSSPHIVTYNILFFFLLNFCYNF